MESAKIMEKQIVKEPEQRKALFILQAFPGILLCIVIMLLGIFFAYLLGNFLTNFGILPAESSNPISGIFVAILLGILIRNVVGLKSEFEIGVKYAIKFFLKAGIILLGIRLSLLDALKLGMWGVPIILVCIASGLLVTLWLAKKLNQSNRLATLTACGTGICGVTAIMATSPAIKAKDDEVSYAIANITIFGLIGMLAYPYLAFLLFGDDPIRAGLFLGTAIHDTAQVTGAALIFDQTFQVEKVVDVATITKLTRNVFIVAVIPIMTYFFLRKEKNKAGEAYKAAKWYQLFPFFVLGFLLFSIIRTFGDAGLTKSGMAFGILTEDSWMAFYQMLSLLGSQYILGVAMAAVGLSTSFKVFKGLGMRPFYVGLAAALSVGVVSISMVYLFGGFITM